MSVGGIFLLSLVPLSFCGTVFNETISVWNIRENIIKQYLRWTPPT